MAAGLTRKQLIQLFFVATIGWGAGQVLQHTAPIGRDLTANMTAKEVLTDHSSPTREVKYPTLTLVVFTDYQCPACKLASPAMDAAVARDGHVRVIYKDWPIFGAVSENAARVVIASDRQGLYPAIHTRLMAERRPLTKQVLREVVERSGGDWTRLQSDLRANSTEIDWQLNRNRIDAFRLGIAGTPAYLAGPILISGALDEAAYARVFALSRSAGQP
ncbi:MAG: disulfide bond formation protein DsbA [Cytophagaceae bacterium]|nr:MAG: disulfide bond formation protein DsbA [Cytophagaceae bacterium]